MRQELLLHPSAGRCLRVPRGHDKLLVRHEGSFLNYPPSTIKYDAKATHGIK